MINKEVPGTPVKDDSINAWYAERLVSNGLSKIINLMDTITIKATGEKIKKQEIIEDLRFVNDIYIPMIIDHICIAVKNIAEATEYWEEIFGYTQLTKPIINTRQKVKVVFLRQPGSITVKLIEPMEENRSLASFVEEGGGFHHICFKCDDLNEKIIELKSKGVRMLVPPQPGEAFADHDIAFFWAKNRINFELIDTDQKAGIIDENQ